MLHVVYVGNFFYPFTTENHIARSLEQMRVSVTRLQEDRVTVPQIEDAARSVGADLVLYTRTWGKGPELTDVWRRLEHEGIKTASYHLDLYFGLSRETGMVDDPFWTTQYVFTADGDPRSAERFDALGINHHWMPPAIVEDEAYLGTYSHRFAHDVAFVGMGPRYHPEHGHRQMLLLWAIDRYEKRFRRYGPDAEIVRGPHLNDLYASVGVVLGDSLCLERDGRMTERYVSDRLPETLGRGGVLTFPRISGIAEYYGLEDGVHCRFYDFGDFDTLGQIVDELLGNRDEARMMATRGQAHIVAKHTYSHRMREALRIMGLQP